MKIKEIEYGRTFNLGDFESKKITLRAEITENDNLKDVYLKLNDEIIGLYLTETKFIEAKKEGVEQAKQELEQEKRSFPSQPTPKTETKISINDIKQALGNELANLVYLNYSEDETKIYVSPIKFLGKTDFGKLYNIVSGTFGGRYVSQGQDSHFVINLE